MESLSQNPQVQVTEISKSQIDEFLIGERSIQLVARTKQKEIEGAVMSSLRKLKDRANTFYVLEWEGNRIPRGVRIDEKEIGWTQHGNVTSTDGTQMGFYDRAVDSGGDNGKHQVMIVYTPK